MADESPLDRFRQALTGAARAIGRDAEAEVAWTSDAPAMQGKAIRVPMPATYAWSSGSAMVSEGTRA